jgi:hypothetical protein
MSSGITYYRLESNGVDGPKVGSATTINRGFYGVPGIMEHLLINVNATIADPTQSTDITALMSQFRLIVNGEVVYDWTAGSAPAQDSALPGRFGYFINSIGGRFYQEPMGAESTTANAWIGIPVGLILNGATPRFEITVGWYDAGLTLGTALAVPTVTSEIAYWARFNTATQVSTRVLSATSFVHAANAIEQVVARVPTLTGSNNTVLGVFVQDDKETDDLGTQGIRSLALSQFGMPITLNRWANGEMNNGVAWTNPAASDSSQTYASYRKGALMLPLYGLNAGDVTLLVDNGATGTTRLYSPVITSPLSGANPKEPKQTMRAAGNNARKVIQRTETN